MDQWTLRGSSNVVERREHRRMQVLLAAEVADGPIKEPARVVEISARGVRICVSQIFQVEQKVVVRRGEAVIPGRVVWRSERFAEIAFDTEIDERAFLRFRNERHRCPTCDQPVQLNALPSYL
jgi:hypothetical protein